MDPRFLDVLACPQDREALVEDGSALRCASCGRRYPIIDGIVSFLLDGDLDETDRKEQESRDAEAGWYHGIFAEYTNRAEIPPMLDAIAARPRGPVMDHGAGTGRVTTELARFTGEPIIALDYSLESLRILVKECHGLDVLAVHADGRRLPIRTGALAGLVSAEVYAHFRADGRAQMVDEVARCLMPNAPAGISALNFNLIFRLWKLKRNSGAKEGEHLFGGDFYYLRMTPEEFRQELSTKLTVERLRGVRNIPARSLAGGLGKVLGRKVGGGVLRFMTAQGYKADRALGMTPLGNWLGFFVVAQVRNPG
jgi:uncharacterized protein YbaR (Trm112 family)